MKAYAMYEEVGGLRYPVYIVAPSAIEGKIEKIISIVKPKKPQISPSDILFFLPDIDIMSLKNSYSQELLLYKDIIRRGVEKDLFLKKNEKGDPEKVVLSRTINYFSRVEFGHCYGRVTDFFLFWCKVTYYNTISGKFGESWKLKRNLKMI